MICKGWRIKATKSLMLSVLFTTLFLHIVDPGPAASSVSKSNCQENAEIIVIEDNIYIGGSAGLGDKYYQYLLTYDLNGNYIEKTLFNYRSFLDNHDLLYANGLLFTFSPTLNGLGYGYSSDVVIIKLSPSGEIQWTYEYNYGGRDVFVQFTNIVSIYNDYYVGVTRTDQSSDETRSKLLKLNSSGGISNEVFYNEFVSFAKDSENIYVLEVDEAEGGHAYSVIKFDANLDRIWERPIEDSNKEYYKLLNSKNVLIIDEAENLYCVLTYGSNTKFQILKIGSDDGNVKWVTEEDNALGIIHNGQLFMDQNGDIVVMFARDNILYKFNSLGEKQWGKKVYPDDWDVVDQNPYSLEAEALLIDDTNNYYIIGYDVRGMEGRIYIIKTNQHGEIEWSEINDDQIRSGTFAGADFDNEGNIITGGTLYEAFDDPNEGIFIGQGDITDAVIYKYNQDGVREFRAVHDIEEDCDPFNYENDEKEDDEEDTCGCGCS
jgi:hypothetical protein